MTDAVVQQSPIPSPTPSSGSPSPTGSSHVKKPTQLLLWFGVFIIGLITGALGVSLFLPTNTQPQLAEKQSTATPTPQKSANPSSSVFGYPLKNYPVAGLITASTSVPAFVHNVTTAADGTVTVTLADDTGTPLSESVTLPKESAITFFYDPVEDTEEPIETADLMPGDKIQMLFILDQETLNWKLDKLRELEK
jgi:hypothetical protein